MTFFVVYFSMVAIRGLRSGVSGTKRTSLSDEEISRIVLVEVFVAIREAIPELFGSS